MKKYGFGRGWGLISGQKVILNIKIWKMLCSKGSVHYLSIRGCGQKVGMQKKWRKLWGQKRHVLRYFIFNIDIKVPLISLSCVQSDFGTPSMVVFRVLHSFSTEINFCQEPLIVNDERSLRTAIVAESSSLLQGS